jgi:hypothetical protein
MPILEIAETNAQLRQGDVLHGINLYATGNDWEENKGSSCLLDGFDLCMVVSRPCVLAHKSQIVVVAVRHSDEKLPKKKKESSSQEESENPSSNDIQSFAEIRCYLEQLRDGDRRRDRFYLGQIPDHAAGRYYACFDSFHTCSVPPPKDLEVFLQTHRVVKLSDQFSRDLHIRLFAAFASLGFDDTTWYSTPDLEWLVHQGQAELEQEQGKLNSMKADLAKSNASGTADPGYQRGLEAQITNQTHKIEKIKTNVTPLQTEFSNRPDK